MALAPLMAWPPRAQELELIKDDDKVFKLMGPVLMGQDVTEVKSNVSKRLEFINKEMYVPALHLPHCVKAHCEDTPLPHKVSLWGRPLRLLV